MRFLLGNALSPLLAQGLRRADHDAVHVRDRSMQSSPDEAVFELAAAEARTSLTLP